MALGGGTFTARDKVLPGSYINIVSVAKTNALGTRGTVTMPFMLDWGPVGKVIRVTADDFKDSCLELFGYERESEKVKPFRELFRNAQVLYAYRLANQPQKASCQLAEAVYPGEAGNRIRIQVSDSVDEEGKKHVITYVGSKKVDIQTVSSPSELKENAFVTFKTSAESLENTEAMALTGGSNGAKITGEAYQEYLDAMESYAFTVMVCDTGDDAVKTLFKTYTERMNEETGAKFQCVLHKYAGDYEGVISVDNEVAGDQPTALVYWTAGAAAGCSLGESLTNKAYDGEYEVKADYTQKQLRDAISSGAFVYHMVDDRVRVLKDINTLKTISDTKGEIFRDNKTVRVVNQIAVDIAAIFNTRYLGMVPNDEMGRCGLKNDIVLHHQELEKIRAISGFSPEDVTVTVTNDKGKIEVTDSVTVTGTMEQLYMTVLVQ